MNYKGNWADAEPRDPACSYEVLRVLSPPLVECANGSQRGPCNPTQARKHAQTHTSTVRGALHRFAVETPPAGTASTTSRRSPRYVRPIHTVRCDRYIAYHLRV